MNPSDYVLQPSNVKQPTLLDEEITTTEWPMPPVKAWSPAPKTGWSAGLLQDDCRGLSRWLAGRLDAVRRLGV